MQNYGVAQWGLQDAHCACTEKMLFNGYMDNSLFVYFNSCKHILRISNWISGNLLLVKKLCSQLSVLPPQNAIEIGDMLHLPQLTSI